VRRERSGRPNSWHCEAAPLESIFQPVRLTLLVKCSSCLHHSKAHRRRSNVFNHLSMAYYLLVPNFPDYNLWLWGHPCRRYKQTHSDKTSLQPTTSLPSTQQWKHLPRHQPQVIPSAPHPTTQDPHYINAPPNLPPTMTFKRSDGLAAINTI
jgi:hypothetical protein